MKKTKTQKLKSIIGNPTLGTIVIVFFGFALTLTTMFLIASSMHKAAEEQMQYTDEELTANANYYFTDNIPAEVTVISIDTIDRDTIFYYDTEGLRRTINLKELSKFEYEVCKEIKPFIPENEIKKLELTNNEELINIYKDLSSDTKGYAIIVEEKIVGPTTGWHHLYEVPRSVSGAKEKNIYTCIYVEVHLPKK